MGRERLRRPYGTHRYATLMSSACAVGVAARKGRRRRRGRRDYSRFGFGLNRPGALAAGGAAW